MREQADEVASVDTKKFISPRGGFEINANPEIVPPVERDRIRADRSADGFAHEPLAKKYGASEARAKIGEMVKAFIPGTTTTPLLVQKKPGGMSLVHVWFGANFPLFRHSHPRFGDCLYYVVAGEIIMGSQTLKAGSTFFVPNGQPYKYKAGQAGVELLEFRAGGGVPDAPGMKLDETSFESIDKIIDESYANDTAWQVPTRIGDTAIRQAEVDDRLPRQ